MNLITVHHHSRLFTRHSIASCCWFRPGRQEPDPCLVFHLFWFISEEPSSDLRVAGLAGQAPSTEIHSWSGLGPVVTVTVGRAIVVDLWPPGVRGDHPRGGPPLLQGIWSFYSLLDLFSGALQDSIRLHSWQAGKNLDKNHIPHKLLSTAVGVHII